MPDQQEDTTAGSTFSPVSSLLVAVETLQSESLTHEQKVEATLAYLRKASAAGTFAPVSNVLSETPAECRKEYNDAITRCNSEHAPRSMQWNECVYVAQCALDRCLRPGLEDKINSSATSHPHDEPRLTPQQCRDKYNAAIDQCNKLYQPGSPGWFIYADNALKALDQCLRPE